MGQVGKLVTSQGNIHSKQEIIESISRMEMTGEDETADSTTMAVLVVTLDSFKKSGRGKGI